MLKEIHHSLQINRISQSNIYQTEDNEEIRLRNDHEIWKQRALTYQTNHAILGAFRDVLTFTLYASRQSEGAGKVNAMFSSSMNLLEAYQKSS